MQRIKDIVDGIDLGQINTASFRKVPSQATTAGVWCDLSMSSGNPSPNFYSGTELTATTLEGSKGLFKGSGNLLFELLCYAGGANAAPITLTLCDYLLFYPQIDMDSVDTQFMVNDTPLPRYETGEGVRMFLVAQYPYIGGVDFIVNYTNSEGVSGRTTGTVRANTATNISSFVHSGSFANSFGAFLPFQDNDKGVRSVDNITFLSPNGGLGALVLVKPLYTTLIREFGTATETNCVKDSALMPEIKNGAYLNFIALPNANISGVPIQGHITTIW